MASGAIYDHAARLRSYEILGEIGRETESTAAGPAVATPAALAAVS
jgi:hypothetical protein